MMTYPDDSDGDALRRLQTEGNDMSAPMSIEYPVLFGREKEARTFAAVASRLGYGVELYEHEDDPNWDVICTRDMVPDYGEIIRIQEELNAAAKPFGGHSDGWGSFGNVDQA
jgi:regulator of RNase E activity RraB